MVVVVLGWALSGGCTHDFPVTEHKFVISNLRASTVAEIKAEIEGEGVNVQLLKATPKGAILGEPIQDQEFTIVIVGDNYGEAKFAKITRLIMRDNRSDPIVLRTTKIEQEYASASGEGNAAVKLRVEVTENAKAYYRETGLPVEIRRSEKGDDAWFEYQRRANEEYVDIYVVPEGATRDYLPVTFLRISLSYPYRSTREPWQNAWQRVFNTTPAPRPDVQK